MEVGAREVGAIELCVMEVAEMVCKVVVKSDSQKICNFQ